MTATVDDMASGGLEGVVAATTQLSHVDGERGELVIAGYQVDELAEHATFEETTWLLWHGDLPSAAELDTFGRALAVARDIPDATLAVLRECAHRHRRRHGRAAHGRRDALARPGARRQESSRGFRRSLRRIGGCVGDTSHLRRDPTSATPPTSSTC